MENNSFEFMVKMADETYDKRYRAKKLEGGTYEIQFEHEGDIAINFYDEKHVNRLLEQGIWVKKS